MADPSTQWQQREGSGARYGADAGAGPSASGEPTSITGKHLRVRASNLLSSGATYLGTRNWEGLAAGAKARALELTERARGAAVGATADGQEARGGGGSGGDSEQEGRAYRPPRGDGTESGRGGRPSARKSLDSFRRLSTSTTSALSLRTRTTSENLGTEEIALLPGFALRKVARDRHPQTWGARDQPEDLDDGEVELYVPLRGFVSKRPEVASRSQRVFFQMAKQLASLPKVPPLPTAVAASPAALLVPGAALVSEPTPIIEDADERASDTESAGDDSLSAAVAAKLVEGASDEKLLRLMQGVGALPGDKREIDVAGGAAENEEKHQDATIEREKLRLQVPALTPVSAPAAAPYSAHSTSSANSTAPSSPDSAGAVSLPSPRSRTRTFGLPRPTSRADSVSSVASAPAGPVGGSGAWADRTIEEIRTLQRNLDERLRAFWTTRMEGREARVEITPVFAGEENTPGQAARSGLLATTSLWSDSTGQISHDLVIPWHVLSAFCKSHQPVAQGRHPNQITALDVRALLMPRKTPAQRAYDWAAGAIENADGLQAPAHDAAAEAPPIQTGWQRVTISEDAARKVRVISDVDDTVKVSGVIEGVRRMFHNVFVRDYTECAVPGVADWYGAMSAAGAGVHYVSNAPLELHSLVRGFLRAAGLPDGHVHLKHYPTGGRSLFAAWWEPASDRKRAAVQAILNAFPRSRFLLIGDSGELDLELYTALAAERPEQIAAIFIRDVSSPPRAIANFSSSSSSSSARRPAHPAALAAGDRVAPPKPAAVQNNAPETPPRTKRLGADDSGRAASQPAFFSPSFPPNVAPTATSASGGSRYSSPQRADPSTTFNPAGAPDPSVSVSSQTPSQNREAAPAPRPQPLTENEIRRVAAFSSRVTRARAGVPRGTRLRFFTDAKECEEEALRLIREIQRGTR